MDDFDIFYCDPVDFFGDDVNSLVLDAYKATLEGIERLDKRVCDEFRGTIWSHPDEESHRQDHWEEQLTLLRYHAGNMGLVSLVTLFDAWMIQHGADRDSKITQRFEKLEKVLGPGPLSLARFENIGLARNSIIHHSGAPEYPNGKKKYTVETEFIAEISDGDFRVGISGDLHC